MTNLRFYIGSGFLFILLVLLSRVNAQESSYFGQLEASTGYISPERMPFWLRTNQGGDVPSDNFSMGYRGVLRKEYDTQDRKLLDWGFGFEGKLNLSQNSNVRLIEGYGKTRLWILELKAGRSRDMMGLADSTLSLGAFSVSGTAPGIPKVEAGIFEFYTLPFLGHMFAFKGNLSHGWFGEIPMRRTGLIKPVSTYFHQKSLYGRFGKEHWRLKLYGGFNHQVQWGNEADLYGTDVFTLSLWETFLYMFTGKPYGTEIIATSKIGNHLGSIDAGFEYDFDNIRIFAYRQFFYDIGALYYLGNVLDGLNGLTIVNTSPKSKGFRWEKALLEIFYSKNQSGELWSPITPSGDENYYNNFQFVEGWSYQNMNIGNSLIGTRQYIREDLPNYPLNHFINNRVIAFHTGFAGSYDVWKFMLKATYSLNYGTYGTSEIGHSMGTRRSPPRHGIFEETTQFSGYLQVSRSIGSNYAIGLRTAFDNGGLYYNSAGSLLYFSRNF
jgi:hypothetical protein